MEIRFHILAGITMVAALAAGADTAKKTTAPVAVKRAPAPVVAKKSTPAYTAPKRVPVKISKTTTRITTQPATQAKGKAAPRTNVYYAPRQSGPSPERYKEIQDALISKGYLEGPATGVWDQNSMSAMKKYQEEQKQEPTGKITAKSLITLGLGPKDDPTTGKP